MCVCVCVCVCIALSLKRLAKHKSSFAGKGSRVLKCGHRLRFFFLWGGTRLRVSMGGCEGDVCVCARARGEGSLCLGVYFVFPCFTFS